MFYEFNKYYLVGFERSQTKNKMYDAVIKSKQYKDHYFKIPFGDKRFENYHDLTGLNLYPHLIHGDKKRRERYRKRHKVYLKKGYYSPGFFSYYLW